MIKPRDEGGHHLLGEGRFDLSILGCEARRAGLEEVVHPLEAEGCKQGYISVLEKLCKEKKCVAVGEIGLDYHYDFSPRDIQKTVFEQQLVLAKELDLPVNTPFSSYIGSLICTLMDVWPGDTAVIVTL